MRPHAVFALPDGSVHTLGPGDLIGRMWTCALCLDDGRVSEAHALVSGRGDELRLMALRGRFTVDDAPRMEVALAAGQRICLAEGLELRVVAVALPDTVLGVEGPGVARQALLGVVSVRAVGDGFELLPGYVSDADAQLWGDGDGWHVSRPGQPTAPVQAGVSLSIRTLSLRFVDIPLRGASAADTLQDRSRLPVRIVALHYEARLERDGQPTVRLDGIGARVISELVAIAGPVPWTALAREIWRDETDELRLRRRWDVALHRLRLRLREAGLRAELVRSDRSGIVTLDLAPGDSLVDET
jgi:hypothetical protein